MKLPDELVTLVGDPEINKSLPVQFQFEDKDFIVDIMLFFDLDDPENFDSENNRIRFARNGEGFILLADLGTEGLRIMQEEFGNIDYIGVTIFDLVKAKWQSA